MTIITIYPSFNFFYKATLRTDRSTGLCKFAIVNKISVI